MWASVPTPTRRGRILDRNWAAREEIDMRMQFVRPVRIPLWLTGITICLLAVTGMIAVAHSIGAARAGGQDRGAPAVQRTAAGPADAADSLDREALPNGVPATISRRSRASCAECGVVESTRRVDHYVNAGRHDAVLATGAAANPILANGVRATTGASYEVTVRLRDGSRTTFTEPTPRAWRPGSRVMVIAGLAAADD
jgi:hypothetical protein